MQVLSATASLVLLFFLFSLCICQYKMEITALGASYRNTIVIGVSHHFILNFLPAFKWFVNQDLWCVGKGLGDQCDHLLSVISKAWTQSTQGKCRPDQNGIAESFSSSHCLQKSHTKVGPLFILYYIYIYIYIKNTDPYIHIHITYKDK